MTRDTYFYRFFIFLLVYSFVFPTFHSSLGSLGAMVINGGIMALSALSFFIYIVCFRRWRFPVNKASLFFIVTFSLFAVHICVSIFIGMVIGNIDVTLRDVFELHRPVLYFLIFSISYLTFYDQRFVKNYSYGLVFVFFLIVTLGLVEYFSLSQWFSELYTKRHNVLSDRIASPFVNPYDYAFVISFFVFFFMIKSFFGSRWNTLLFMLSFFFLLLPQSRSVVAGIIVGLILIVPLVFFFFCLKKPNVYFISLSLYLSLIFIMVILLVYLLPYLSKEYPYLVNSIVRFVNTGEVGTSGSIRLEQFEFALKKAENPLILIFGNGPAKSEMEYVESIYNYQFYRYGLVGIITYFLLPLFFSVYLSYRLLSRLKTADYRFMLALTLLLWILTIPFMLIGNNFTEQVRISFFYYSILGFLAASSTWDVEGELSRGDPN